MEKMFTLGNVEKSNSYYSGALKEMHPEIPQNSFVYVNGDRELRKKFNGMPLLDLPRPMNATKSSFTRNKL